MLDWTKPRKIMHIHMCLTYATLAGYINVLCVSLVLHVVDFRHLKHSSTFSCSAVHIQLQCHLSPAGCGIRTAVISIDNACDTCDHDWTKNKLSNDKHGKLSCILLYRTSWIVGIAIDIDAVTLSMKSVFNAQPQAQSLLIKLASSLACSASNS